MNVRDSVKLAILLVAALGAATASSGAHANQGKDAAETKPPAESTNSDNYPEQWSALVRAGDYAGATEIASRWVRSIERADGVTSARLFTPLQRYASTLEAEGKFAHAQIFYQRAVDIAKLHFDAFDPRLVDVLTALGRTYLAQRDFEAAETPLLQAQGITHRNAGLLSIEQDQILEFLSESYRAQGKLHAADQQQRLVLATSEKAYGDSPDLIPALHDWARWNAQMGRFPKVGESLQRALSILEQAYGPNDIRLVDTLDLIARLYRFHPKRVNAHESEDALQRIVNIYDAQSEVDEADLMAARTRVGDWYMLTQARSRGLREYRQTVADAARAAGDDTLLNKYYGHPKVLFLDGSERDFFGRSFRDKNPVKPGYIVIRFDVMKNGSTANVKIVEDTLSNAAISREVRQRVQSAIYRPRFENGEAVNTRGLENLFEVRPGGRGLEIGTRFIPRESQTGG